MTPLAGEKNKKIIYDDHIDDTVYGLLINPDK